MVKQIHLGHMTISVTVTDEIDPGTDGGWLPGPNIVKIRSGLAAGDEAGVLFHELAHAVYAMDLKEGDTEERVCTAMGNRLAEMFMRNPSLRKYIGGLR